ncbi:MAG: hypothetical protein WCL50_08570, partial [Spirochaetota bacterium]
GDLKAILMAVGGSGLAALKQAIDPGRVTGLVSTSPKAIALALPGASFILHPDDKAIVAALRSLGEEFGAERLVVPWVLDLLPGSKSLSARNIDLASRPELAQNVP